MANDSTGKWILKNLIGAVAFVAVLCVVISIFLNLYTRHGKSVTVPDFSNVEYTEASRQADSLGIKLKITDSVYVRRMARNAVYSQYPKAGSSVKKGRQISVSVNNRKPQMVSMPKLIGYQMKQASSELRAKGLVLHRLIYVPDMATNNVLHQQYKGSDIQPGHKIPSGSDIDLVVGLNESDNLTKMPDVKGMRYLRAVNEIHDNSLNVKKAVFDKTVRSYNDTLNSVVYKQQPGAQAGSLTMGAGVTIYLTADESVLSK